MSSPHLSSSLTPRLPLRRAGGQLLRFAWLEARSCVFAAGVFLGLALAWLLPLPVSGYDFLLAWCVALTLGFWALGIETWREVLVICGFHVLGLALEVFKVAHGSWSYPGTATLAVGGVPLFSGFMYAAVGSYICQAWRHLDLRVSHYPALTTTVLAVLVYANFFTHHYVWDLRVPLAVALLVALRRCQVHFRVGDTSYRMPLALSFLLIGLFLWVAENAATFLDAWKYPGQVEVWEAVHTSKVGSWALLVSMSFVLVATVKSREGVLHHPRRHPGETAGTGETGERSGAKV